MTDQELEEYIKEVGEEYRVLFVSMLEFARGSNHWGLKDFNEKQYLKYGMQGKKKGERAGKPKKVEE